MRLHLHNPLALDLEALDVVDQANHDITSFSGTYKWQCVGVAQKTIRCNTFSAQIQMLILLHCS